MSVIKQFYLPNLDKGPFNYYVRTYVVEVGTRRFR